jgi:hypothetical protein
MPSPTYRLSSSPSLCISAAQHSTSSGLWMMSDRKIWILALFSSF